MTLTIRLNGQSQRTELATVAQLLAAEGIERRRGVAVAVNGEVVPARRWEEHRLADGDDVEIVRPIGGG